MQIAKVKMSSLKFTLEQLVKLEKLLILLFKEIRASSISIKRMFTGKSFRSNIWQTNFLVENSRNRSTNVAALDKSVEFELEINPTSANKTFKFCLFLLRP